MKQKLLTFFSNEFTKHVSTLVGGTAVSQLINFGLYFFIAKLYSPANDTGTLADTYNVVSLKTQKNAGALDTTDKTVAFNELPVCGTVTITVI